MPLIRAVLFDFGLVLSGPPDPLAHRRMETILDTTDSQLRSAYWRHRDDYDLGVLTGPSFWQTVGSDLGHPLTDDDLTQLLEADVDMWTQPNQPIIDWTLALQNSRTLTGILSNMGDSMEHGIAARFPWVANFSHSTFSHRLGISKPDARIYRHAIAGLGVPAEQILFLDDRPENVEAARALRIHAIQYSSHEGFLRAFNEGSFTGLPHPAAPSPPSA